MKKFVWKCPRSDCEACGKKPMARYKASRHGRLHLKRVHKNWVLEPIVVEAES